MSDSSFDLRTIIRLAIWSTVIGAILYWLKLSPTDVYSWFLDVFASIWGWVANTGFEYMLLGAAIVIPWHFISRARRRDKN